MRGRGVDLRELRRDIRRLRAVDGGQRGAPARRQQGAQLRDDVGAALGVGGVVEDRVAEEDDVRHGNGDLGALDERALSANSWFVPRLACTPIARKRPGERPRAAAEESLTPRRPARP